MQKDNFRNILLSIPMNKQEIQKNMLKSFSKPTKATFK